MVEIKASAQHSTYCRAGFGGSPTAVSRIAVPCPSDRNALRNPPRQHVPTVSTNFEKIQTMKEVKGIGFSIPSENDDYLDLDSTSSLSETDIAIFAPNLSTTSYSTYEGHSFSSGEYEGKKLYNRESSSKIYEHIKHWNKELLHFVSSGGTLFVVLCKKEDFYVYTGTKDISGTGRNQKVTNHVAPASNYDFMLFPNTEYYSASGKNVYVQSSIYKGFAEQFKNFFTFEVYITNEKIKSPSFTTKNKDRILGASLRLGDGLLIFIPNINLDKREYTLYDTENDIEYWSEEAITKGKMFVNNLVEIDRVLRQKQAKTPKPEWLENSEFELKEALKTKKIIAKNVIEINKRKKENENLNSVLIEQEVLKNLLFETGKPLELAVSIALKILGYKTENYDDGELELDQIITSPEGVRYIGECEGKDNKDIDVSKFRQLLDGLNADFEKENVVEKAFGLLIGNPQRLMKPNDRTLDFTLKCKSGAKREKIGLIKTTDLFFICRYIKESNDIEFAKKCRIAIHNQLGEVIKFPKIE